MKRILVALALILSPTLVSAEGWFASGPINDGNDLSNPAFKTYLIECPVVTTIRARTEARPELESPHVETLCIAPASQIAKGDKEIAQWPERRWSHWAEATGCQKAIVTMGCDHNATCNNTVYHLHIECVGVVSPPRGFLSKIRQVLNR